MFRISLFGFCIGQKATPVTAHVEVVVPCHNTTHVSTRVLCCNGMFLCNAKIMCNTAGHGTHGGGSQLINTTCRQRHFSLRRALPGDTHYDTTILPYGPLPQFYPVSAVPSKGRRTVHRTFTPLPTSWMPSFCPTQPLP